MIEKLTFRSGVAFAPLPVRGTKPPGSAASRPGLGVRGGPWISRTLAHHGVESRVCAVEEQP